MSYETAGELTAHDVFHWDPLKNADDESDNHDDGDDDGSDGHQRQEGFDEIAQRNIADVHHGNDDDKQHGCRRKVLQSDEETDREGQP